MASKATSSIPPVQQALMVVILMVLLAVVFYMMFYSEAEAEVAAINTKLAQQNTALAEKEDERRNLLEVQDKADRLEKRLKALEGRLPETQEELNDFLSAISQRGQNARLGKWLRFEQLEPEPRSDIAAMSVPIEMEFIATFDSATAFFWELSSMGEGLKTGGKEQIVNIRSIEITRDDRGAETGNVHVNCVAETFLFNKNALKTDDDSGGGRGRRGRRRR